MVVERSEDEQRIGPLHNLVLTCRLHEQADAVVFYPEVSPERDPS